MNPIRVISLCLMTLLINGCASQPPLPLQNVNQTLTPRSVLDMAQFPANQSVLWGGMVIASSNHRDLTQLEILAYPLRPNGYPQSDKDPVGRFLAQYPGYLELANLPAGQMLWVKGRLVSALSGRVGESSYQYPLIEITQWHHWKLHPEQTEPRFHFGLGFIFGD